MKIRTLLVTTSLLLLCLIVASAFSLFSLKKQMDEETAALKLDKELEVLATQLQNASDYLTNEVRAYTQFGDVTHYDNYWYEVNETKTRDNVVARLEELHVPSQLLDLVALAQQNSNNLIQLEEKAMEAVAKDNLPLARELVYGTDYSEGKKIIAAPLAQFRTELQQWTDEKITATENNVQRNFVVVITLLSLVVLTFIVTFVLLFKKITPLRALTAISERFATGDLRFEAVETNGNDEVSSLSRSFNAMAIQLQDVLMTVQHTSENLAASSTQLTASITQTDTATVQVTTASEHVAAATNEQSIHIEQSNIAVQEVMQDIQQIERAAEEVASLSAYTTSQSELGEQQLQQATTTMRSIEQVVSEAAQSIQQLRVRSQEIDEIVQSISSIAAQTNLLALNASIEAARAGEHGKSFAVVANEVQNLATQSNASAQRVSPIIQAIQQEIGAAVAQMEHVFTSVHDGVTTIEKTAHSFAHIYTSSHDVTEKGQHMLSISSQIATHSANVASSFNTLHTLAKRTSNEAHNVSSLTEEQLASIQEIAASTNSLTTLAATLNKELAQFKM